MNAPRKRPAFAALAPKLEALGFRPSKRFGQNFLVDDAMCREIAAASEVEAGDFVLEVGVGLGFLTHHLLLRGARVLGIEIDSRLAAVTREWIGDEPNLELCVTDVLDGKHALAPAVVERLPSRGPWHLVSNLPYAVASPVVALLARLPNHPQSMTVLVQHEVAERFVAQPGDDACGALSLRLSLSFRGKILRSVPASLFRPRPKVDSSICRLEAVPERAAVTAGELAFLDHLVGVCFTQRRKLLRAPLSTLCVSAGEADLWIAQAGIDRDLRVERLDAPMALALVRTPTGARIRESFADSASKSR
jgi:16S rRNA (adenine1518-N6/adenine1519-N6)-dimethyltransferase